MKRLILFCVVATVISAQQLAPCASSFKGFMECLAASTGDASKGKVLEQEFDDDFKKQCTSCFDPNEKDSVNRNKCKLSQNTLLNTDVFGPDGPLQDCKQCQEYGKAIKDQIFNAPDSVRKCVRDQFTKIVVNDLQPCIKDQVHDQTFTIPPLPDFDEHSGAYLQLILDAIGHRIMAYSRMSVCSDRDINRYKATSSCLDNKSGYYSKHCDLSKSCLNKVSSSCQAAFTQTKDATCTCLLKKRQELYAILNKVKDAVFNKENSVATCTSGVTSALGHWVNDLSSIKDACNIKTNSIFDKPLGDLIKLGCTEAESALSDNNQKATAALNAGFNFVGNVLDALSDRVNLFCEINCFK